MVFIVSKIVVTRSSCHLSVCFRHQGIDGRLFLQLSKEQIANLTGMKVGPSLKIHDLIQALKVKAGINPETTLASRGITTTTEAVKVASS